VISLLFVCFAHLPLRGVQIIASSAMIENQILDKVGGFSQALPVYEQLQE
jgi:hypothetical protein